MKIEKINSFRDALNTGINIFAGAGFSILAKDKHDRNLPLGASLAKELGNLVNIQAFDLPQIATIIKARDVKQFTSYLTERFTVGSFDDKYLSLGGAKIKYFFTTNIDDLFPKIISRHGQKYIQDIRDRGEDNDENIICYLPLHGNVDRPNEGYVFSTTEISTIFSNAPRIWNYLSLAVEKNPTLFIGYSLQDSSTLQAIFSSRQTNYSSQKDKWILLHQPTDADKQYFSALGFHIIEGSITDFLNELPALINVNYVEKEAKGAKVLKDLFKGNLIPEDKRNLRARGIIHYFQGLEPIWGDILSGNIVKTSQYTEIKERVLQPEKHTIVIGAPLCGKTTAAMQVGSELSGYNIKLYFDDMTSTKAEYILKFIGDSKTLIMVDNFADEIDGFLKLTENNNIKLVGIARSSDFGIVSHRIDEEIFNITNVTEVSDQDLQNVYTSLPRDSKKDKLVLHQENKKYKKDTIFEFVLQNIKGQSIEDRYKHILSTSTYEHVEFLTLCAYMHYCRVPLSLEVAASYFAEDYSFDDVFGLKKELNDLIKDFDDEDLDDMDYYYPRSFHLADVILRHTPTKVLASVIEGIVRNVPQVQIPRYHKFKRRAFDHRLISRAFRSWKNGIRLYEEAFRYDYNNPYVLQQEALYLAKHDQFRLAFDIIDKAKTMTNDSHFSIRNTHAIILFEANYRSYEPNALAQLDESMNILKKCYKDDKRKTYHAVIFAEQAMRYYKRTVSDSTMKYLLLAKEWLTEEKRRNPWDKECTEAFRKLDEMLERIG